MGHNPATGRKRLPDRCTGGPAADFHTSFLFAPKWSLSVHGPDRSRRSWQILLGLDNDPAGMRRPNVGGAILGVSDGHHTAGKFL